jgi:hypothetical protein
LPDEAVDNIHERLAGLIDDSHVRDTIQQELPTFSTSLRSLTRANVGNGPVWMTATPLLGMSDVVRRFLQQKSDDRFVIQMQIDDVGHFSAEEKARIIASYPPHELEART